MVPIEFSPEVIAKMRDLAQSNDYPVEAYNFVLSEIVRLMSHRGSLPEQNRGISDHALCWKLHDCALREFKDRAKDTLAGWSIHKTRDFGAIVYGLVDKGLVTMRKVDSLEDFDNVFDFDEPFQELHYKSMPLLPTRWRVSTLLAITTVLAIAFAGISKSGLDGAVGTLLSTWLIAIGSVTIYLGVNDRTKDWLIAIIAGIVLVGSGILGFVVITS